VTDRGGNVVPGKMITWVTSTGDTGVTYVSDHDYLNAAGVQAVISAQVAQVAQVGGLSGVAGPPGQEG
jgi:hypothetical protein